MGVEVKAKPKFPIMGNGYGVKRGYVPMEFMQRFEQQAIRNHSQSISRLAERGGLTPQEAMAVIQGRSWDDRRWRDEDAAWANLQLLVSSEIVFAGWDFNEPPNAGRVER